MKNIHYKYHTLPNLPSSESSLHIFTNFSTLSLIYGTNTNNAKDPRSKASGSLGPELNSVFGEIGTR